MDDDRLASVRRWVLRLTIASFATAALLGIAALLVPGPFGSVQGRILLTTLVVGATSILTLCYLGYLAVGGTPGRWLGAAGGAAALVSAVCVLDIFWLHWQHDPGTALLRTFGVSAIVALTLAQFSLLLTVVRRRGPITLLLRATLVVGTVLAVLLAAAVLGWDAGDGAARLIGVVAILDVLGTVVTIALGLLAGQEPGVAAPLTVVVPDALAGPLRTLAAETGRDPADLVLDAVAHYVGAPTSDHDV
jgi:hypothetical protein